MLEKVSILHKVLLSGNKTRLDEIKTTLGFNLFFKKATDGSQSFLIDLLERFKTNMVPALQTEIVTAGGNLANITTIKALAASLPAAKAVQEALKGSKTVTSSGMITDFNDAYDELMGICKVCQNFYKKDPVKQQLFSYTHTIEILRGGVSANVEPSTEKTNVKNVKTNVKIVESNNDIIEPSDEIIEPTIDTEVPAEDPTDDTPIV